MKEPWADTGLEKGEEDAEQEAYLGSLFPNPLLSLAREGRSIHSDSLIYFGCA